MDISINYLGMNISSPVIAGSCSITGNVNNHKKIEESGAGAVVLKSIFEEEIYHEYQNILQQESSVFPDGLDEYLDYYDYKIKEDNIRKYLRLIEDAKSTIKIPVVASINCTCSHEWLFFAKKVEEAGADAIELNLFIMPSDFSKECTDIENIYLDIAKKITQAVKIPVSIKLSYYFSNLGAFVKKLSETDIQGVVLFNRFFHPDFDIDRFTLKPTHVFSSPSDLGISLRWASLLSGRLDADLIASTGVHSPEALIKLLLAGADAVQVASALYTEGISFISQLNDGLKEWMERHAFEKIDDFKGKMSQVNSPNPAIYERVQFMKYFGDKSYDLD